MRRLALTLLLISLTACNSGQSAKTEPNTSAEPAAAPAAGPGGPGGPGDAGDRTPFIHCLDLFRERRYAEALKVCREAEKLTPGDPQLLKAIELSEKETGQSAGQGGEGATQ
jgi:hypothetical protein